MTLLINPQVLTDTRKASRALSIKYRRRVLKRNVYHCQVCGYYDPTFGDLLKVHHIVWVERGGNGYPPNLIGLCSNCHTAVHEFAHHRFTHKETRFASASFEERIGIVMDYGYDRPAAERMVMIASQRVSIFADYWIIGGGIEKPIFSPFPPLKKSQRLFQHYLAVIKTEQTLQ